MSAELAQLASHLVDGTLPEDRVLKKTCMKIALVFTCLAIRAKEDNDPISFHITEKGNERTIIIKGIHATWTLMVLQYVSRWDIHTFDKVAIFPITQTIDVYAAFERLLRRPCTICTCEFTSEINRERCIQSHVHKKKPGMRCGTYPIDALCDFWDGSSASSRTGLLQDASRYVTGIPDNASFSPIVSTFFEMVKGTPGKTMSGRDLMIALDLVSENTFMYNVSPKAVLIVSPTRGDYLASMAHEVMRNLAEAQAEDASQTLLMLLQKEKTSLLHPQNTQKTKKKKKFIKAKKQPVTVTVTQEKEPVMTTPIIATPTLDEQLILDNVQKQMDVEDQYAKEAYSKYIDRLEKNIFSRPAMDSITCWADFD